MGEVKIMKKNESVTYGKLPNKFFYLTEEYCSLGQDFIYYRKIKAMIGNMYRSFLNALRDAACFSKICDEFIGNSVFKISLLREKEADRVLQFVQYELNLNFLIIEKNVLVLNLILENYAKKTI